MKHLYISFIVFFFLPMLVFSQIIPGQIDEFTDDTNAWLRGTIENGELVLLADGVGSHGKLVTFNQAQWAGDYLSNSITHIRMRISNPSTENVSMRVALGNGVSANSGTWYASTNGIEILAGETNQVVEFPIIESALTLVNGSSEYTTVFNHVVTLRILHSELPAAMGDPIVASISLDNIEAISNSNCIPKPPIEQLKLYPNPAYEKLTIEVNTNGMIEVFDITGNQINQIKVYKGQNQIDLSSWISGVYILRITDQNQTTSKRLIIE